MGSRPNYDFVYPRLSRAGLGNLLFPWAKAVVASSELGIEMLPPKWLKVRLGPTLRGDRDSRRYHRLFIPPSPAAFARREWLLATATLWGEDGRLVRRGSNTNVLVITTMDDHFRRLTGSRELLISRLVQFARPDVLREASSRQSFVAMHIRLGDFRRPESVNGSSTINLRTPIDWFVTAAQCVRSAGWDGQIVVCSDGTNEELEAVLEQPRVIRSQATNPLADLLTLASARLVVGSGSSFSAWGAFLGGIQLYVAPGMNHFLPGSSMVREVAEWHDGAVRDSIRTSLEAPRPAEPRHHAVSSPLTLRR
jgi:hypothetical protein